MFEVTFANLLWKCLHCGLIYMLHLLYCYNVASLLIFLTIFYHSYNFISLRNINEKSAPFNAIIVGSGFSGINVAIKLQEIGVPFIILEKGRYVGGTWNNNVYPGAACDVPSHLYSFSFCLNPWWSQNFGLQPEIRSYIERVSYHFRLRSRVKFDQKVTSAVWSDTTQTWTVSTHSGGKFVCHFLFSCCGELHVPNQPNFEGLKEFKGPKFHTAEYDTNVSTAGKKVAIIGTGASAVQLVPEIAKEAKSLHVFQRSAVWALPTLKYNYRWQTQEATKMMAGYIRSVVQDPEVADKLTPNYDLGCKRLCPSNDYLPTFNNGNVHLVTSGIKKVTKSGIETEDETRFDFDVIIFAIGFNLDKSYKAFKTTGKFDTVLQEQWGDTPSAYYGTVYPDMPNMFLILGPNTGSAHNSRLFIVECQVNYAISCIKSIISARGRKSLCVKRDVYQRYNEWIQVKLQNKMYSSNQCHSYYKNKSGIVFTMWPDNFFKFWWFTRKCREQEFDFSS